MTDTDDIISRAGFPQARLKGMIDCVVDLQA